MHIILHLLCRIKVKQSAKLSVDIPGTKIIFKVLLFRETEYIGRYENYFLNYIIDNVSNEKRVLSGENAILLPSKKN